MAILIFVAMFFIPLECWREHAEHAQFAKSLDSVSLVLIESIEQARRDSVFLSALLVCELPFSFQDIAGFQMVFVLEY